MSFGSKLGDGEPHELYMHPTFFHLLVASGEIVVGAIDDTLARYPKVRCHAMTYMQPGKTWLDPSDERLETLLG